MAASEDTEYDYPEQASKNLNRSIQKRAENIKVVNGDLMYVKKKGFYLFQFIFMQTCKHEHANL